MRFAAVADIHGNALALEAVIEDLQREGIDQIVNLGDVLSGPIDPAGGGRADHSARLADGPRQS